MTTRPSPTTERWGDPTPAGVWFSNTGDWVRLPSGVIYSTQASAATGATEALPPIGVTPQGSNYCVGYSEYGAIWLNYDPHTGATALVHWTHRDHKIVVTRPLT
jgi:hypothetical protein